MVFHLRGFFVWVKEKRPRREYRTRAYESEIRQGMTDLAALKNVVCRPPRSMDSAVRGMRQNA